jgi:hypothetical protein
MLRYTVTEVTVAMRKIMTSIWLIIGVITVAVN